MVRLEAMEGETLTAGDIEIPSNTTLLTDAGEKVCQVSITEEEDDVEEAGSEASDPASSTSSSSSVMLTWQTFSPASVRRVVFDGISMSPAVRVSPSIASSRTTTSSGMSLTLQLQGQGHSG